MDDFILFSPAYYILLGHDNLLILIHYYHSIA